MLFLLALSLGSQGFDPTPDRHFGRADITDAVRGNEIVLRVVFEPSGSIASMGQGYRSCYDGKLVLAESPASSGRTAIWLGGNSPLSREGQYNSAPSLVASIGQGRYLINLACGPDFPNSGPRCSGSTGNVVLYEDSSGELKTLTRSTRSERRYTEAVAWFEEESVVFVLESDLGTSDHPSPDRKTSRARACTLDGRTLDLSSFPRANAFAKARSETTLELHREEGREPEWRLRSPRGSTTFAVKGPGRRAPTVIPADLSFSWAFVGHASIGTWLVRLADGERIPVSHGPLLDADPRAGAVVIRFDRLPRASRFELVRVAALLRSVGLTPEELAPTSRQLSRSIAPAHGR